MICNSAHCIVSCRLHHVPRAAAAGGLAAAAQEEEGGRRRCAARHRTRAGRGGARRHRLGERAANASHRCARGNVLSAKSNYRCNSLVNRRCRQRLCRSSQGTATFLALQSLKKITSFYFWDYCRGGVIGCITLTVSCIM